MTCIDALSRVAAALAAPARASSDFDFGPHGPARVALAAAVLVPLRETSAGVSVVLTRRAAHLRHHPGQIALPGGRVDPGDASAEAAALREAAEEIGLAPSGVRLLGRLPVHTTVTGFAIEPFVGVVPPGFVPVPEAAEVGEVFEVPLAHLADPARYRIEGRRWQGEVRRYRVVPWGPYYIWGATARILWGLATAMTAT